MKTRNIFRPTEAETARAIESLARSGKFIDLAFGPSGVWFEWAVGEPEPEAVTMIRKWRGEFTEGVDGAGI